jgi:hypothetical protein
VLDGDAVMIASGPDGDPPELSPFVNTAVATKPETCEKRRALCEGVGRTFREAVAIVLDRPSEALAVLKKRFAQLDERHLALAFEDVRRSPRSLTVSKAGLETRNCSTSAAVKPERSCSPMTGSSPTPASSW